MKFFLWVLLGFATIGLAVWIITVHEGPLNPLLMAVAILVFAVPPVGGFWMMYMAIRYEKHPLKMVLLAYFIPYSFLWYYFERVRPKRHIGRYSVGENAG